MKQYFLVIVASCLVLVKTYSDKELEYVYKFYNENVTLKCPETENVTWKQSEWCTTSEGQVNLTETKISEGPLLEFTTLTKQNQSIYKCFSNDNYIKYFRLVVDKPKVPYFRNEVVNPYRSRFKGNFVLLKCPSHGGYLAPDITWFHNGKKLGQYDFDLKAIKKLELNDTGNYTCVLKNEAGTANFTYQLEVFDKFPSKLYTTDINYQNITIPIGTSATLICTNPSNHISELTAIETTKWFKLPKNVYNLTESDILKLNLSVKLIGTDTNYQITKVNKSNEGWYACVESGRYNKTSRVHITSLHYLSISHHKRIATKWITAGFVLLIILIIVMSFTLFIYYRKKINKEKLIALEANRLYWTKKIIVEKSPDDLPVVKIERHKAKPGILHDENGVTEYQLPLDPNWEICRENLVLGEELGSGAFGTVLKAEASEIKPGEKSIVAVKMLKEGNGDDEMVDLVSEMEIMKMIGQHPHIINLIGCCTQKGPLYVVVEYAPHGNLLGHLRKHQSILRPNADVKPTLTERKLVDFASQVARGMEYLTSKKFIHRDLAARNILVSENLVLKIADFGLAKECDNYYRKKSDGLLPVKWTAPEALILKIYTTKSDVWSFGILMYEIMTFGEVPYPTLNNIEKLVQLLNRGYRMPKPSGCSQEVYKIMRECWNHEPSDRPGFSDLIQNLQNILEKIDKLQYACFDANSDENLNLDSHSSKPSSDYGSGNTSKNEDENEHENLELGDFANLEYFRPTSSFRRKSIKLIGESSLYKMLQSNSYKRMDPTL